MRHLLPPPVKNARPRGGISIAAVAVALAVLALGVMYPATARAQSASDLPTPVIEVVATSEFDFIVVRWQPPDSSQLHGATHALVQHADSTLGGFPTVIADGYLELLRRDGVNRCFRVIFLLSGQSPSSSNRGPASDVACLVPDPTPDKLTITGMNVTTSIPAVIGDGDTLTIQATYSPAGQYAGAYYDWLEGRFTVSTGATIVPGSWRVVNDHTLKWRIRFHTVTDETERKRQCERHGSRPDGRCEDVDGDGNAYTWTTAGIPTAPSYVIARIAHFAGTVLFAPEGPCTSQIPDTCSYESDEQGPISNIEVEGRHIRFDNIDLRPPKLVGWRVIESHDPFGRCIAEDCLHDGWYGDDFTVELTFTETVVGFSDRDLRTSANAVTFGLSQQVDATTYTVRLNPKHESHQGDLALRVALDGGVTDLHGNALFDSVVAHAPRTNLFNVPVDFIRPEIAPLRLDEAPGFGYRRVHADLTGAGLRAAVINPNKVDITASNPEGCVYLPAWQSNARWMRTDVLSASPRVSIIIRQQPCAFTVEVSPSGVLDAFGRGNLDILRYQYPPAGMMQEAAPTDETDGEPTDEPAEPPARPTGLSAKAVTHGAVTLQWDDPQDDSIITHTVYRRDRDGVEYRDGKGAREFEGIATTGSADTTHIDPSVEPRRRYVYRVTATNAAGESERSSYANVETLPPPVPAQPTGLAALAASHEGIDLSWDDPGDSSITGYEVLRRSRDGDAYGDGEGAPEFAVIDTTGGQGVTYPDRSVTPRTRYVYQVVALNEHGASPRSGYANAETEEERPDEPEPENTPATGAPSITGTAQVGETLMADTSGIEDEDGLDNAAFTYQWLAADAGIDGATDTAYTLTDSDEGKAIKVRVSFTDDSGNPESLTSAATAAVAEAEAEPTEPPPAPTNLTAVVNEDGSVTLSWEAPDDDSVTGYQILRRRPTEGEDTLLIYVDNTGSTATTYTDTNVTAGVRHVYRVKAINDAGAGDQSNYVNVDP